jgi:DNA-binding MarR family transcriptional regulator
MVNLKDLCQVKDLMAAVVQVEATLRKETGLNLNQSFALCCLAKGPRTAGALADELRIHGASLSRILKNLVQKGFITRDAGEDDNRHRILSLTDEGRRVATFLEVCESRIFPVTVAEKGLAENL